MTSEIREGKLLSQGEEKDVLIIDYGEDFNPEVKGSIPNHDKVTLVYPDGE